MRARIVPSGHENTAGAADTLESINSAAGLLDARRISGRADQDKVVEHKVLAIQAKAPGDKGFLGGFGMHQQDVPIAATGVADGLAGADGDHVHRDSGVRLQFGQDKIVQPAVFRRGGGLYDQLARLTGQRQQAQ